MTPAIEFVQVSKRFLLHHERPQSLQESLVQWARRRPDERNEELWSLKDLSFEIGRGTMVGLIGPNGAGKSTCLKMVSRIMAPTSGTVHVNGRVSALLELGAGFHPDLTGRENIFLNGSVLGLHRVDMEARFDEIVDFAGLERFIDTPVKHYSSGMYMRLGFAVATSVEAEVLVTDEILAVGDLAFQRRCFERLRQLRNAGATVLIVSHDLRIMRTLCDEMFWLDAGQLRMRGPAAQVIDSYETETLRALQPSGPLAPPTHGARWGSREVEITRVELLGSDGVATQRFFMGEPFRVRMHYHAPHRVARPMFGVAIHRADGWHVNGPNTVLNDFDIPWIEGDGAIDYVIESMPLQQGDYYFTAALYDQTGTYPYDHHDQLYPFTVERAGRMKEIYGSVYIPSHWEHHSA